MVRRNNVFKVTPIIGCYKTNVNSNPNSNIHTKGCKVNERVLCFEDILQEQMSLINLGGKNAKDNYR